MKKFIIATASIAVLFSTLNFSTPAQATNFNGHVTHVVAHAGGKGLAPENTVYGMATASAAGAKIIEVDVRWSANNNTETNTGFPVLMHDPTVDRTTNGTGTVAKLGYPAMTAMLAQDYAPFNTNSAYNNVHVPYAYDFLWQANQTNTTLLMDIKITPGQWNAWRLMSYVDRFPNGRERMIFMGPEAAIRAMRQWYPDLKYALIEWPAANMTRTVESLQDLGVQAYAVPINSLTSSMVDFYRNNGIQTYTWTTDSTSYDNASNWLKARDVGADFLITDHTPEALATIGSN